MNDSRIQAICLVAGLQVKLASWICRGNGLGSGRVQVGDFSVAQPTPAVLGLSEAVDSGAFPQHQVDSLHSETLTPGIAFRIARGWAVMAWPWHR